MREVFERLERLGVPYFMTDSEALARYSEPRQTMDFDIVVGLGASEFDAATRLRVAHATGAWNGFQRPGP